MRAYQRSNAAKYPNYWNQPVPGSGPNASLMIVGLAPGLHGANQTGIPFTGDASGELLFRVLDNLQIRKEVRITNAVKCAPPENKPLTSEKKNCRKFLIEELEQAQNLNQPLVLLCLGRISHEETLRCLGHKPAEYVFSHGAVHKIKEGLWLVDSYHCSRYNIQTNRLTEPMFQSAVQSAATLAQLDYANV